MSIVTTLLILAFLAIAIVHALWGFRIWWPQADEQLLARTVVGRRGIKRMPSSVQCFAVAIVMSGSAILVGLLGGWLSQQIIPDQLIDWAGILLAAGLLLRGLVGFTGFWQRLLPEEPFHTLDRRYYSPLCVLLALGIAGLLSA